MQAKDIMSVKVVSVTPKQTLKEVMELFFEHKVSGFPVVDNENKVIGILSERDIVRYCEKEKAIPFASVTGWLASHVYLTDLARLKKGVELLAKTTVEKVMRPEVITAKENLSISDAAKIMNRHRINRIPIVDQENRLSGIITRDDLVNFLAEKDIYLR